MVGLSFYGSFQNFLEFSGIFRNFLVIEENNIKTLATDFSSFFLLHYQNQVVKIVTLIFRIFCLLQKCLR